MWRHGVLSFLILLPALIIEKLDLALSRNRLETTELIYLYLEMFHIKFNSIYHLNRYWKTRNFLFTKLIM